MSRRNGKAWRWILPVVGGGFCALAVSVLLILPTKWAIVSLLGLLIGVAAVIGGNPSRLLVFLLSLSIPFAAVGHIFLKRDEYHALATPGITFGVVDCILLLLYAIWFCRLATRNSAKARVFFTTNILALGFILINSVSIVNSADRMLSVFELMRMIKIYFVFFYISNAIDFEDFGCIVAGLLLGVSVQSGLGIAQYLTNSTLGMSALGGAEENMSIIMGGREDLRVAGTILHPNQYALYLCALLPLALSLLLSVQQKALARASSAATFAIGLVAILLSFSRTGWICLALAVALQLLYILLTGKMTSRIFLGLSVAACTVTSIVLVFSRQIVDRMFASDPEALTIRSDLMRLAWAMIREHPLIGIGINNFARLQQHWDPIGVSVVRNVHNLYALTWAETGLFGLLIFLGFLFSLFGMLVRPLRSSNAFIRMMALGLGAGLLGFAVDGLADYSYRLEVGNMLFWFLAGLTVTVHRISQKMEEKKNSGSVQQAGAA
jgi:putative inorganic carbon (HCO3(-)) transporter